MTDNRVTLIAQIALATIFGVGLIVFIFALVFFPANMTQVVVTVISNLLSVLVTVVVMQNTHFFKPGAAASSTGDSNVPTTVIHANTVYHSSGPAPVPVPPAGGPAA